MKIGTLNGIQFEVRPQLCILATGGIENARLLLASNSVQTPGLGNGNDLVGRYFMEHVTAPGDVAVIAIDPQTRHEILRAEGLVGNVVHGRAKLAHL